MRSRRVAGSVRRGSRPVSQDVDERVAEIMADLEDFDAKLTERGWVSNAEVDEEAGVIWFWPPSMG